MHELKAYKGLTKLILIMTEHKDTTKLQSDAKEFIPKNKAQGIITREGRSGSLSLNPAAKEFIPKTTPIVPLPAPFMYIPPLIAEGNFRL
jgi:hypothetical protein